MKAMHFLQRRGARTIVAGLSLGLSISTVGLAAEPPPVPPKAIGNRAVSASPRKTRTKQKSAIRRIAAEDEDLPKVNADQPRTNNLQDPTNEAYLNDAAQPIDLPSALRLAGVENLEIVEARQRVEFAVAIQQLAAAQFLPNINLGTNYDAHTGDLQQSNGNILNLQRSALYVGAGANAVAAGTVSIPGVQWNLNVSEGIFNYLASQQRSEQSRFATQVVENEVFLKVATAYTDLLEAHGGFSLAIITRNDAREVARLTANYAKVGEGRASDAERAATELRRREEDVISARAAVGQASRRLAELLNLNVNAALRPVESQVVPQPIVPNRIPLNELVAVALLDRPELKARQAAIQAAMLELRSAKILPFSPQVMVGLSGGVFGGGSNLVASSTPPAAGLPPNQPRFGDFKDRTDIDAIMYWSLRNLGLGNKALIDVARSRMAIADLEQQATLDQVRREVAEAFVRVHIRFAEIDARAKGVRSGVSALAEDFVRVQGREGLPIEVLDSLRHLATERRDYLDAIVEYNKAQFELYVALGKPPADMLARPVPQDLSLPPEK